MSELFQFRSNLEIILYTRANTGSEQQRKTKQDYSTVFRSETKEQHHAKRTQSRPNEEFNSKHFAKPLLEKHNSSSNKQKRKTTPRIKTKYSEDCFYPSQVEYLQTD